MEQKLQREITNQRGAIYEQSNGSPTAEALSEAGKTSDGSPPPTAPNERTGTETKRRYRRHPKLDKTAPDRPLSAYVIFSNQIREEVRAQNLSFTDIAKLVGDRWQKLTSDDKEPFESLASAAKERFNVELSQYKKTISYKDYTHYIAEFKAKHSGSTSDGKRPKLDQDSSGGSGSRSSRSNEFMVEARPRVSMAHTRDLSIGSVNSASYHGGIPPSKVLHAASSSPTMTGYSMNTHLSRIASSPATNSPPRRPDQRELRVPPVLPVHDSLPVETHQVRCDLPDLHSHAGQLSLASPLNGVMSPTADLSSANRTAAAFPPPLLQHQSSASSVEQSDSSSTSNPPPVTPMDEPWLYAPTEGKARSTEWPRIFNPLLANNHSAPFGPLPPLHTSDRVPDITRDLTQRTLPFPAPSSPHDPKASFRGHARHSTPLLPSESSAGRPSEARDEMKSPLENSENDAANVLAVLAYTGR